MPKPRRKRTNTKRVINNYKKQPPVSYNVSKDITKNKLPEIKRNTIGEVIYSSQYIGDEKFEYWVEYDESGFCPVRYHDSRGYEWKCKYNSKGNISDFWDNTGYQEAYLYYTGNTVVRIDSFGCKVKKRIDRTQRRITRTVFINES